MAAPRPTISIDTEVQQARFTVERVPTPTPSPSSSSSARMIVGNDYEEFDHEPEADQVVVPSNRPIVREAEWIEAPTRGSEAPGLQRWAARSALGTPPSATIRSAARPQRTNHEAILGSIAQRVADRMIGFEDANIAPAIEHLCREMIRHEARLKTCRTDLANLNLRVAGLENATLDREDRLQKLNLAMLGIVVVLAVVTITYYLIRDHY